MYIYINLAAVCLYVYKQYFSNCEMEIETISNFYPGLFWAKKKKKKSNKGSEIHILVSSV